MKVLLYVIVLGVVLLSASLLLQPQANGFDKSAAWNAVLKDVQESYPQSDKTVTPIKIEQSPSSEWKIDAKVSLQPHSACPTVFVRHYNLNPIRYREEQVTRNCEVGGAITFEEEAIIASGKSPEAKAAAAKGGEAYATFVASDKFQSSAFSGFLIAAPAVSQQNVWIVEWKVPNEASVLVAIDGNANIIKSG
ncbi:MAG TPA: hypothetical protein VGQ00_00615 [Candidatus Norongarragalinales archaeon]|jgi:hypothetical protein|nr:hypothetical protein [Candidatus Norongarragalinales archaeon]